MTLTVLKKNFHNLIDKVDNQELLDQFYMALTFSSERKEGMLINSLTEKEKRILMKSYKESEEKKNQVTHEKVMRKYSKWLAK